MDRLESMSAFVAVADLRGFASAARRLGWSNTTVTRQVASLERHLGLRLMQRTTRSVTLTDAGTRYLERARRILADVAEAEAAALREKSAPVGRFVVAAPLVFGRLHVAPVLSRYLASSPAVTGALTLADRAVNLIDEGIDVAVRIGELADSSLVARLVGHTRRVVVGSPRYLRSRGSPARPAQLGGHELIACTSVTPSNQWRFERETVTVSPRFATNSVDAAIDFAEQGGGLTMVLAYLVAEAVRRERLTVVLSAHEPEPLPIHLLYPSSQLLSAKVRTFVDLVTSTCDWRFGKPAGPRR